MRIFKKIVFICLAFLPFLPLIFYGLSFIGNDVNAGLPEVGTIDIAHGIYTVTPNSLCEVYFENIVPLGEPEYTGIAQTIVDLQLYFYEHLGVPVNIFTTSAFWLTFYYGLLFIIDLLIDLVFFIPKKVMKLMEI